MTKPSPFDIGRIAERLMHMDDATWERHANPISGWSRLTALPLIALAIWSRAWLGLWAMVPLAMVVGWIWLNPRLFARPRAHANWMSQGILGERIWLARHDRPIPRHHQTAIFILNLGAGAGLALMLYGLWRFDLGLTLAGLILSMGSKLWVLDRMVWLKRDTDRAENT